LVASKAGNLWRYELFVGNVPGLNVGAEYNAQMTFSGVSAMAMAGVKPIAINCAMLVNPVATNAVKTAQLHSWWYEDIARIDPAQRYSDPPSAYISGVNQSSQRLFSLLTLCIMISS